MARPSRTGGKTGAGKTRKATVDGRNRAKTKRRIAPTAIQAKHRPVSGPSRDLKEARAQQAATAEILKVIASSPDDVQPVLEAVAKHAMSLLDAWSVLVTQFDGELLHFGAACGALPDTTQFLRNLYPTRPEAAAFAGRCVLERSANNISDAQTDSSAQNRDRARLRGFRAALSVPMLRDGEPIGVITVSRREAGAFAANEVELLQTFADQAVIAIGNVRLFEEVQAKTRDLEESLQQQTATADVLKVISRSAFNLRAVLDTLLTSAARLCQADHSFIFLRDGDAYRFAAGSGGVPEWIEYLKQQSIQAGRGTIAARAVLEGRSIHIPDVLADEEYTFLEAQKRGGFRTALGVPLLREGISIGVMVLTRPVVRPFDDSHIALVTTFADQAVIAIKNVELFQEVQARTDELSEALRQQTATGEVLKVIASSPTDVEPVLQAICESACTFCNAYDAGVLLRIGDNLQFSAHHGPIRTGQQPRPINREWVVGRSVLDKVPVQVSDFDAPEAAEFPEGQRQSREQGHRCTLSVPLLREGEAIGAIALRRLEPVAFGEKQVALLQTFAHQAVIAIGNVRLFEQVQAKTLELTVSLQQQTATAQVLQVISSSPGDLEPVFNIMLENATRICEAEFGHMFLRDGDNFVAAALRSQNSVYPDWLKVGARLMVLDNPHGPLAQIVSTRKIVHIIDLSTQRAYTERNARMVALVESSGARTFLGVPMFKDEELIGVIAIYRQELRPFTPEQVTLVSNFASQAVIAIENARLLNELRRRTDELSSSLDDLRTAQDRLIQTEKLASLGQLTAGIAHEIKNPLNFVNNFSALSVELTDELNDALKEATLADKIRAEVDELTGLLKNNLAKVVQHGQRADSIVKNMLLHSREGSGELRAADINGLVEESLNLAYHGARAEKPGFNITLQREFDASAGSADLFPQEITRALLNLISNGFYAANKRKIENGEAKFEPTLWAKTKNLGGSVEIRIGDNGTGIPPEVKQKMFNPFFTTKPAGEGTGLGLSMTHDIIVKQHGGTIRVDTEPGGFTEFILTLPRAAGAQNSQRSIR